MEPILQICEALFRACETLTVASYFHGCGDTPNAPLQTSHMLDLKSLICLKFFNLCNSYMVPKILSKHVPDQELSSQHICLLIQR
jgi:hypothetical protein